MNSTPDASIPKTWRPLDRYERRVAGVLVEKSKTTQDSYPMTLNAITIACNQKSNRYPLMDMSPEQTQLALDRLREYRAVIEVHGDGRVPKFKHLLYEWLGVEKIELSIMAELLLRGQQTLGELRARASRMDEIAGLDELKTLTERLIQRGLVVELTPAGRGQMVTHNLYYPEEMQKVRQQVGGDAVAAGLDDSKPAPSAVVLPDWTSRLQQLETQLADALRRIESLEKALS